MKPGRGLIILLAFLALAAGATLYLLPGEPASSLGVYHGYSEPRFPDWVRTSQYVPVRDGTLLAVDLYRPARGGEPVSDPLPLVWRMSRYHRVRRSGERIMELPTFDDALARLLEHGYVVAVVDARGTGASFGSRDGPFAPVEADDAFDLTEWFASRPFCDGNVGMFGRSYGGIAQFQAAASHPPSLRAVLPEMAMFDLYSLAWPGGIFREGFARGWSDSVRRLDLIEAAVPVDGDPGASRLARARAEHQASSDPYGMFREAPFRDSPAPSGESALYEERSPDRWLADVNSSGVPVYQIAGWYDVFVRDAVLWFANLETPKRLVIGPWSHTASDRALRSAEMHRWFDWALKGKPTGIDEEAPLHYYVMGAGEWRSAETWPLPEQEPLINYLHGGPQGGLVVETPSTPGAVSLQVDYTASSGPGSRWANGFGEPFAYPDMSANDARGLSFTSAGLRTAIEVTGHPVVHLWVAATAPDVDVVAYLEDVGPDGSSTYVTEGALRASHRSLADPPFDAFGLPWHDSSRGGIEPLGTEPAELAFDLLPTSYVFGSGHRIRLAIHGADRGNLATTRRSPAPTLVIHTGASHPSRLQLPLIP